jgi:hypothetical protein
MNDSGITLEKLVPGFSDFTDSLKKDIGRQLALRTACCRFDERFLGLTSGPGQVLRIRST